MSKFLIVTPVISANYLLADTISSIVAQDGLGATFSITYVIADAGGGNVQSIIERLVLPPGIEVRHLEYKDTSMYDGLVNAIIKNYGDFDCFSYINSGDMYSPYALKCVSEFIGKKSEEFWITGCIGSYDENGYLYKLIEPVAYPGSLIEQGFYGRVLPFVQQESTFFSYSLIKSISLESLRRYKYAGDYYIWKCLAKKGIRLEVLPVWLAGFREHEGQLSSVYSVAYMKEFILTCDARKITSYIKSLLILGLYVLHPRLRPKKIVEWCRRWS